MLSEQDKMFPMCHVRDLIPNCGVTVLLGDTQVALFYLPDEQPTLYALDHYDPLSGVYVLAHGVIGDVNSELVVASPIYKQHYSLVSGRCLEDPDVCVGVHNVILDQEHVYFVP